MLRSSFRKAFLARSREAVLLLIRMPLTEANRPALAAAARRAAVEALLAARFPLVRICHAVSILASSASGAGIPEGAARIRALRAALKAAESESEGSPRGAPAGTGGTGDLEFPGCPFARVLPLRGRLPLPSAWVESARASGSGLRILRFRPSGLKGSASELSERLTDLSRRGMLRGLYALTGEKPGAPAREFALFVPDRPPGEGPDGGDDPLAGFPVNGRIRTLLASGRDSVPDIAGFFLVDGDPGASAPREDMPPSGRSAPAGRKGAAGSSGDGQYRNAVVLRAEFADLLTSFQGSDPRRSAGYLNRVLARLASCVQASGGIVDTCSGGGLSAFWGAPGSTGGEAEAAGRAALGMRRVIGVLSRGRTASGQPPLRLLCALDAGPVLAARLGAPGRTEYTVAGEAVRRSSGMGIRNERWGTDILVSEYAMRLMGPGFRFHPVDRLETASGGVGVYALLGRSGDPSVPRDLGDLRKLLGTA